MREPLLRTVAENDLLMKRRWQQTETTQIATESCVGG
jgi:hypothetical protein